MRPSFFNRRRFLAQAGAWLGASSLRLRAEEADQRVVSIFHTTDLHGHVVPTVDYGGMPDLGGMARCMSCVRQWRKESPHSLLVDVGDVYQGTPESHRNQGELMMRLFNQAGYDAWTLGNHDFDWGREALEANLALSASPVLTGNLRLEGKRSGEFEGAWKKVVPWTMKEVGGFRIALIGLVTPGLPYWLMPETSGGASATPPAEALRRSIRKAREAKADAIVVIGHMGLINRDDEANPVRTTLEAVQGVDVFLGGHTHRGVPSTFVGETLYSQAAYHGIACGRVDLAFDLNSRKLVAKSAMIESMDARYALDPAVMELAAPEIREAGDHLKSKVCTVARPLKGKGVGSEVAMLLCSCFQAALKRRGVEVDGVYHGTFGDEDLPAGEMTVADCWRRLPYENLLVVVEMSVADLEQVLAENGAGSNRTLWPFEWKMGDDGHFEFLRLDGEPVARDWRLRIAMNSYDSQSAGRRLMKLREIVLSPAAKRSVTSVDTRGALIEGLLERETVP